MDRLVCILDDIDDVLGLLQGGLGRTGVVVICVCIGLMTFATLLAGWRGMMLSLMASGLIVALLPMASRDGQ